jgi:hypothetical protein
MTSMSIFVLKWKALIFNSKYRTKMVLIVVFFKLWLIFWLISENDKARELRQKEYDKLYKRE